MTGEDTRPDHALEVPVEAVQARGSRRGVVVALTIGCLLTGSIGVSMLGSQPEKNGPSASSLAAVPSAGSTPSVSRQPSAAPVEEHLPQISSVPLDGAPGLAFLRRDGADLVVTVWHPDGRGLREIARVRDAYKGIAAGESEIGSISSDAAFTLVGTQASGPDADREVVRIVSHRGVVWERRNAATYGQTLWEYHADRVVVPLSDGSWVVVDLEGKKPVAHSIEIDGVVPPGSIPGLEFVARPLAFSADGRWIYGEAPANVDPRNRALFRAPTSGGRGKRIGDLPIEGPARAISDRFDPATGRTVDPTGFPNGSISNVVVRNPDGTKNCEERFPAIVNTAWLGDGRLIVMHSNTLGSPRYLSLIAMSGGCSNSQSLLEAGPLTDGAVFGVRSGYILAGYFTEYPSRQLLLAMIHPDDGRAGTLLLPADQLDGLTLGGWLD